MRSSHCAIVPHSSHNCLLGCQQCCFSHSHCFSVYELHPHHVDVAYVPAVLGRGYNHSVDWWTLGVLMYVLLTARQPFSSPKTHDPMEVGAAWAFDAVSILCVHL